MIICIQLKKTIDLNEDNSSDADDIANRNILIVCRNGVEWKVLSQMQNLIGQFNSSNILRVTPGTTLFTRRSIRNQPVSDAF